MQARVISLRVPPERVEEIESAYRDVLLPETEQHPGFSTMLIIRNEDTGKTLELTLWENEEARRESEREGGLLDWKMGALEAITGEAPTVENYNLWLLS